MKVAIITGATGQFASYLAELLLEKNYKVIAIKRRSSSCDYSNVEHLFNNPNYIIEQGDITDENSISRIVDEYKPDEFYNLAAMSFVAASWTQPSSSSLVNYVGVCNCLESLRLFAPKCKFYQSSSSEVYGDVITETQNENSPARPRSPYASAKFGSESLLKVYRESYGMFTAYSRNFNSESPRRGKEFVTRKITNWIGESFSKVEFASPELIKELCPENPESSFLDVEDGFNKALEKGIIQPLHLGNIDVKRDWTHAKDTVRGIWLILQQETPDDYVLASGKTRSVRDFLTSAFSIIGIHDWEKFVVKDPKFYRPADVAILCGNAQKAKEKLGWEPEISFDKLVEEMVRNDVGIINE